MTLLSDLLKDPGPDPEAQLLAKERRDRLAAAITLLEPTDQVLLIRHYGLGDEPAWTIVELAASHRGSKSAMEQRLRRIREQLKDALK